MPILSHKGVVPDGAILLKTFGPRRTLGLYRTGLSDNWLSLKLVLIVGTAAKGNYVMYWNGERIGGKDFIILETHQAEVAEDIKKYLKENFPNLADVAKIEKIGKTERTSEGVVPENAPKIGELKDIHKNDWGIYSVPSEGGNKRVKIVAAERLTGRANYTVEWNGKRFIRNADFSRLAERIELLAAAEDFMENYVEQVEETEVPWINLGLVGVVNGTERDLLVRKISDVDIEVRLSTNGPDSPTVIAFIVNQVGDQLVFKGALYDNLQHKPAVWAKVEELLKQYFLEKSFN